MIKSDLVLRINCMSFASEMLEWNSKWEWIIIVWAVIYHCRKFDYENYLSTLLIDGPQMRQCAFAVRAFNVEIAKIAGSVCERVIFDEQKKTECCRPSTVSMSKPWPKRLRFICFFSLFIYLFLFHSPYVQGVGGENSTIASEVLVRCIGQNIW